MSPTVICGLGFIFMLVLVFLRLPISISMLITGFLGITYFVGLKAAIAQAGVTVFQTATFPAFSVIPLFILMGFLANHAGMGADAFHVADKWLRQLRGGLLIAAGFGCAAFGAICGDAIATAVTMSTVALPEMRKYKYKDQISTGMLACGGMLGFMIPPSMIFIIYAFFAEQSIGLLFLAGILPGIVIAILFAIATVIVCWRNPTLAPAGDKTTWGEKLKSFRHGWTIILLFAIVIGGLYSGVFTATEAAAAGALAALIIGLATRRLTWKGIVAALLDTGRLTAFIFLLIIGAFVFKNFLAFTALPTNIATWITSLQVPALAILSVILVFHIIIGFIFPVGCAMVLTVPILYPTLMALDINLLWFGVLMVLMVMIGDVSPPVGIVVYSVAGYTKLPVFTVFRGTYPYIAAMLVAAVILVAFPDISLTLPKLMSPAVFGIQH